VGKTNATVRQRRKRK